MNDSPPTDGAYSDKDPLPRKPKSYDDRDDELDESLPSLAKKGDSSLGSLAQAARDKQIHTARNLLFLVGVLQVGFSTFEMFTIRGQIQEELRKAGIQNFAPQEFEMAVTIAYGIVGMFMAAGVAFLVLGALVKKFPLPCTILGLVLFIVVHLVSAVLNPISIVSGIIIKIIFLVGLVKAIQAAAAYQRDMDSEPAS